MNNRMGRPIKEINWEQVENMLKIQCTEKEIASVLGVSRQTLNEKCKKEYGITFLALSEQNRVWGKISLRRQMFNRAKKSDPVLIFMAKNHLGMTDRPEYERESDSGEILKAIRGEIQQITGVTQDEE